MKISNIYIGVIAKVYQNDFGRIYPVISSHSERFTVLHKENDDFYAEDLKYDGVYPIGIKKDYGIGQSYVCSESLTPMFEISDNNKDEQIEKEKVLMLFNKHFQIGE